MKSVLKDLKLETKTEDDMEDIIKETDKGIRQIQEILVKQGTLVIKTNDKSKLKKYLTELVRVGEEMNNILSTVSSENTDKLQKQYDLIKETCELSSIVLKRKTPEEKFSRQNEERLVKADETSSAWLRLAQRSSVP